MNYHLTEEELKRLKDATRAAIAVPFIDDIEDYVVEAIWEYVKGIESFDPFTETRSKKLFDVVDKNNGIGWSVKSLLWRNFSPGDEFELVIQRADVFKKGRELIGKTLSRDSSPANIGKAVLRHWNEKILADTKNQHVRSQRIFIYLKASKGSTRFGVIEQDLCIYREDEIRWEWANSDKTSLKGIRKRDGFVAFRWYANQKQLFERFEVPQSIQFIELEFKRLSKTQAVRVLLNGLLEDS